MQDECNLFPKASNGNDSNLAYDLSMFLGRDDGLYVYIVTSSPEFIQKYKDRLQFDANGEPTIDSVKKIIGDNRDTVAAQLHNAVVSSSYSSFKDVIKELKNGQNDFKKYRLSYDYVNVLDNPSGERVKKFFLTKSSVGSDYDTVITNNIIRAYEEIYSTLNSSLSDFSESSLDDFLKNHISNGIIDVTSINYLFDAIKNNPAVLSVEEIEELTKLSNNSLFQANGTYSASDIAGFIKDPSAMPKDAADIVNAVLDDFKNVKLLTPPTQTTYDEYVESRLADIENELGVDFSEIGPFSDRRVKQDIMDLIQELLNNIIDAGYNEIENRERKKIEFKQTLYNGWYQPKSMSIENKTEVIEKLRFITKTLEGVGNAVQYVIDNKDKLPGKDATTIVNEIIRQAQFAKDSLKQVYKDRELLPWLDRNKIESTFDTFNKLTEKIESDLTPIYSEATAKMLQTVSGLEGVMLGSSYTFSEYMMKNHGNIGRWWQRNFVSTTSSSNIIYASMGKSIHDAKNKAIVTRNDILSKFRKVMAEYINQSGDSNTSFMYEKVTRDDGKEIWMYRSEYDFNEYYKNKKALMDRIADRYTSMTRGAKLTKTELKFLSQEIDAMVFKEKNQFSMTEKGILNHKGTTKDTVLAPIFYAIKKELVKSEIEKLAPRKDPTEGLTEAQKMFYENTRGPQSELNSLSGRSGIMEFVPPQVPLSSYTEALFKSKGTGRSGLHRAARVFFHIFTFNHNLDRILTRNNTDIRRTIQGELKDQKMLSTDYQNAFLHELDVAVDGCALQASVDFVAGLANQIVMSATKKNIDGVKEKGHYITNADFYSGKNMVQILKDIAAPLDDAAKTTLNELAKDLDILVYHNTTPSNTTAAIGVHTLSLMTGFFSRLILSFNYRGLNNNAFTAFSQMIESAFAGEMGNVVSFAKGLAASTIIGVPTSAWQALSNKRNGFVPLLIEEFCPAGSESSLENIMHSTIFGRLTELDIMSLTYGAQENYFKSIVVTTMLMNTKVKVNGKETNLYSAIDEKNGKLVLKQGTTTLDGKQIDGLNGEFITNLKGRIQTIQQRLHGNYSFDRGSIVYSAFGKTLLMMKGWMGQTVHGYYSPAYYNVMLGQRDVGTTMSIVEMFRLGAIQNKKNITINSSDKYVSESINELYAKNYILNQGLFFLDSLRHIIPFGSESYVKTGYSAMSPQQRRQVRKYLIHTSFGFLIAALYNLLQQDDEDEMEEDQFNRSFVGKNVLNVLERNLTERALYAFSPIDIIASLMTMAEKPFPLFSQILNITYPITHFKEVFIDSCFDDGEGEVYNPGEHNEDLQQAYEDFHIGDWHITKPVHQALKYSWPLYRALSNINDDLNTNKKYRRTSNQKTIMEEALSAAMEKDAEDM